MDWAFGGLSDSEWQRISDDYERHLSEIVPTLDGDLKEFVAAGAMGDGLHDAFVSDLVIDHESKAVTLTAKSANLQKGSITAHWSGAELFESSDQVREILRAPETRIIYVETERLGQDMYRMGVLFWPAGEINVRFTDFSLRTS